MNGRHFAYVNPRPVLTIENGPSVQLARCYYSHKYRITSLTRLSVEQLHALRSARLLGYGQEFFILTQNVGEFFEPSGFDEVPCRVVDSRTGEVLDEVAVNQYSGEPHVPMRSPYFVYEVESRVDSSD